MFLKILWKWYVGKNKKFQNLTAIHIARKILVTFAIFAKFAIPPTLFW